MPTVNRQELGESGSPEKRIGPSIEMYGPVARAGMAVEQQRQSTQDQADFRRLIHLEAQGIDGGAIQPLRAKIRRSLTVLPGNEVSGGKGLGQGGRSTHQSIRKDFI